MSSQENSPLKRRRHWKVVVPLADSGLRLDQILPQLCENLSRTQARKIIDIGGVHISGRRVRSCSRSVKGGEEVEVYCDGLPLEGFTLKESDILLRDAYIIALNKPAGIETQPTPARYQGTLYAALCGFLIDPFRPQLSPTIGMVQRLDRDTSGVILFSISQKAHKPLTATIAAHKLLKTYHAIVAGVVPPGEHEVRSFLGRSHRDNSVRSIARGGKEAVTRYRCISSTNTCSLVEVTPVTGRMHQIRVHLSEAGFPLLGDVRYGGPQQIGDVIVPRHMLHASSISLHHPVTHDSLLISAPYPDDFQFQVNNHQLSSCSVA